MFTCVKRAFVKQGLWDEAGRQNGVSGEFVFFNKLPLPCSNLYHLYLFIEKSGISVCKMCFLYVSAHRISDQELVHQPAMHVCTGQAHACSSGHSGTHSHLPAEVAVVQLGILEPTRQDQGNICLSLCLSLCHNKFAS